jgi:hypothetical protein
LPAEADDVDAARMRGEQLAAAARIPSQLGWIEDENARHRPP